MSGRAMQSVTAVKHVDLERSHAVLFDQHVDFANLAAVHGREMVGVVDVETARGDVQHLGVKCGVGAALVQIVLAGTKVVQTRGHAALGGGTTFGDRILRKRRVDARVHVGIDQSGESQHAFRIDDTDRRICGNRVGNEPKLTALDRHVLAPYRMLARPHEVKVLDQQIIGWL